VKKLAEELGKREGSMASHPMSIISVLTTYLFLSRAPRPCQQLRIELGRSLRRIPVRGLHTSPYPQSPPRLRPHPARHTTPREGGYTW
jgi:hypothetical protein